MPSPEQQSVPESLRFRVLRRASLRRPRRALIEGYKRRQEELRAWRRRLDKESKAHAAEQLAREDRQIAELEHRVALLTVPIRR